MSVALLDANVLLALAWKEHLHHRVAHAWFSEVPGRMWATCVQTQASFFRLSMQPLVVGRSISFMDAQQVLAANVSTMEHRLWTQNYSCNEITHEIAVRVKGHNQVPDALLLDLAIRNGGTLATFDTRLHSILPPDSPLQAAIELIPTASSFQ